MKRYVVESKMNYAELFDNHVGDYIIAESEEEAIELYKQWLIDHGVDVEEVEEMQYTVREYIR